MLISTYTPRFFGRLNTWRFSNWAIKVYGISTQAPDRKLALDLGLVDEAHSYVEANLARMNETLHYSVGFAILHHGSAAKSLLTQWWTNECVCLQHVAQSEFSGPPEFLPAKQELMACAYELVLIDFERRAWVSTVMSGKPMEDYLGTWLPDGFYCLPHQGRQCAGAAVPDLRGRSGHQTAKNQVDVPIQECFVDRRAGSEQALLPRFRLGAAAVLTRCLYAV